MILLGCSGLGHAWDATPENKVPVQWWMHDLIEGFPASGSGGVHTAAEHTVLEEMSISDLLKTSGALQS